jgi:hypothetical protein
MTSYLIPLQGGASVTVSSDFFPLTQRNWSMLMDVLDTMMPGLVLNESGMTRDDEPLASVPSVTACDCDSCLDRNRTRL